MSPASRRSARRLAVAAALFAGCAGGDGGDDAAPKPEGSVASAEAAIEPDGSAGGAPVTEPPAAPNPGPTTTTEPPVATTIPVGLPASLNVTPAGIITLGQGSSITSTTTIRGVPVAEVVAWAAGEVEAAGWTVDALLPPEADGSVELHFHGPGAAGTLRVGPTEPADHVRVVLTLGAP